MFRRRSLDDESAPGEHAIVMRAERPRNACRQVQRRERSAHRRLERRTGVHRRRGEHIAGHAAECVKMDVHTSPEPARARECLRPEGRASGQD